MHKEIRDRVFKEFAPLGLKNACAFFQGGKALTRNDTDHELLFRQESYFQYLFGVKESNWYGVLDFERQKTYLFIERLPDSFATWMGKIHPPEYFLKQYEVDAIYYDDQLEATLTELNVEAVHLLHGQNTDSGNMFETPSLPALAKFKIEKDVLFPILSQLRTIKTAKEIELMRYVCNISAQAHVEVMKSLRPGMMEYEMESLFKHLVYSRGGCRHVGYTCICCSGENSSILHYGAANNPNAKVMKSGEICMFDMGGEYHCYTADISRSFPVDGKFTEDQRQIYLTVYDAQQAVMDAMKPGVKWRDMHRLADRVTLERLKEFGFVHGDINAMMENFIASLFFPHGLGHLLGLDTHDVGGYLDPRCKGYTLEKGQRTQEPGLKSLRFGGVLQEGMVITVEPGCYFQRAIFEPAFLDEQKAQFLNIEKIKRFYEFGGVRIEDDVVVTANGIENLSAGVPRKLEEIEALLAKK